MKNRMGQNENMWKMVPFVIAILTIMLLSTMASATVEINKVQNEDSVRFEVKNDGESSTYVLNLLTLVDKSTGNIIYTSQDPDSAEILRLSHDKTFKFELDTKNFPDGNYIAKIYQGDNSRRLRAIYNYFELKSRVGKPTIFTDKKQYKIGNNVKVTFSNKGDRLYANENNWKITSSDGTIVKILSIDCSYGYESCADSFVPLGKKDSLSQVWDQKNSRGEQVAPGSYNVTAEYSFSSSGKPIITISTATFVIKPKNSEKDRESEK